MDAIFRTPLHHFILTRKKKAVGRRAPSPPPFGVLRQLYLNRKEPECRIAAFRYLHLILELQLTTPTKFIPFTFNLDTNDLPVPSVEWLNSNIGLPPSIQKRNIHAHQNDSKLLPRTSNARKSNKKIATTKIKQPPELSFSTNPLPIANPINAAPIATIIGAVSFLRSKS